MLKYFLTTVILFMYTSLCQSADIKRHSDVPKEVYYKFIESENPSLPRYKVVDIFHAVEYYIPRYFGVDGDDVFEEGLVWELSKLAQESSFRNINGDEGKSIGYGQAQKSTCDMAREYNGIKRQLNLIARWDNLHCSAGILNMLHERFGNFEHAIMAYNCGEGCVKYWIRKGLIQEKKRDYFDKVNRKRTKLLKMIHAAGVHNDKE